MKVLVTGGAGFIGSNFIRLLLAERPDWQIVNLDKLTYAGNLSNLSDVSSLPNYSFVRGDIADGSFIGEIVRDGGFDAVVNFAAESHVDRSIEEPAPFLQTNIVGMQILLEASRTHRVPKFLQVSTDEVYGSLGEKGVFSEDDPPRPNSPYAASKAAADLICRAYEKTFDYPSIITRSSNNYGPYQFPEKLIPLMINNALAGKELPVYGDGGNIRDWIFVEDNCRGILAALENGAPGRTYNLGGGNEWRNIDLIKQLLKILDKPESLIRFVADRPGHDRRYALDCSRANDELGWTPGIGFEKGLRATVEWYIEHRPWCERILSGEYQEYYKRMYGDR